MAACYTPDARFSDPAFGELRGDEPGQMWRMLTSQARDLRVELVERSADADDRQRALDRALHVHADRPPGGQRRARRASASATG